MSKIKDELVRIREREFDEYVSFMEWVCDQEQDVRESYTLEEEEDTEMPSTPRTSIIPSSTLKVANNISYNPNRSIK